MNDHARSRSTLERLGGIDTLPPLPYVAHEILLATSTNDADIMDIAATLSREPGLAARIVAMANTAFFTRQKPVYAVEHAVMRLGLNRVRVLAASLLLNRVFDASRCRAFKLERYWHEAVGTAFAAARLAPLTAPDSSKDAAYLGGVLHSIGLLLLVHIFPKPMNEVLIRHGADPDASLAALTHEALGCDYGEAGELLLSEWEVPPPITAVAGHAHRQGYRGDYKDLVETVRFANEWLQHDFAHDQVDRAPPLPATTLSRLGDACRSEHDALATFARLLAAG